MKNRSSNRAIPVLRPQLLSVAVAACFAAPAALALPTGPQVVVGSAAFSQQTGALTVTNTPGTIINWRGFSIGASEAARFVQQSAQSSVLNRVVGAEASAILGALQSNGRVWLVNPNGILFGPSSQIDVQGLVASTLAISNSSFLAGKLNFEAGAIGGGIQNQGSIRTREGGSVYLVAPDIQNSGVIHSPKGEVMLAAGHSVSLVEAGNPDVQMVVSAPADQAVNLGQILVEGGRASLFGAMLAQRGVVSANSVGTDAAGNIVFRAAKDVTLDAGSKTTADGGSGGSITVQAREGANLVSGEVSAKGAEGKGGSVQLLGDHVGLVDSASIDASGGTGGGTVLVGGDYQGKNASIQNASASYMSPDATIAADAKQNGDGGKVIVWSNDATRVYGAITARGGAQSGNGGFVEVSGKRYLDFAANVNTTATHGAVGTLLLDPDALTIQDGAAATGSGDTDLAADGIFNAGAGPSTISVGQLEAMSATTNITLTATNQITIADLAGDETINLATGAGFGFTLQSTLSGGIKFIDANDKIQTAGGDITLTALGTGSLTNIGKLTTDATTAGNINLTAGNQINLNNTLSATGTTKGTVTLTAGAGGITNNAGAGLIYGGGLQIISAGSVGITGDNIIDTLAANITGAGSTLNFSNNGSFAIGDVGVTSGVTASSHINANATSGDLSVNAPVASTLGNVSIVADGGELYVNNPVNAGGNIELIAGGGNLRITDAAVNGAGDVSLSAMWGIDLSWGLGTASVSATGDISISAGSGIYLGDDLVTAMVSSTAGSVRIRTGYGPWLPASRTSISASGDVEIAPIGDADNMWIDSFSNCDIAEAGMCIVPSNLSGVSAGGTLILGRPVADTSYTGTLTVTSGTAIPSLFVNGSKLALNGKDVVIGSSASIGTSGVPFDKPLDILANGNLTVSGDIFLGSTKDLLMNAGQSVAGSLAVDGGPTKTIYAGNITLNNPQGDIWNTAVLQTPGTLSANAYGGINLTAGNQVGTFAATNAGSGSIYFYNAGDFNLGTVTNSVAFGGISVSSAGSITQTGNVTTSGGSMFVTAANNLTMGSGTKAQSDGGEISYRADGGSIQLGLLDAGVGSVYVRAGENITDGNGALTNNIKASYTGLYASTADSGPGSIDADTQVQNLYVDNWMVYDPSTIIVRNSGSPLAVSVYSAAATGQLTITNNDTIDVGHIGGATNTTLTATGASSGITVAESLGTLLSAGDIVLNAGQDILITHDYVEAGGSVTATAGRDIRIRYTDGATGSGSAYIQAGSGINLTMQTGGLYIDGDAVYSAHITTTLGDINVATSTVFKNGSISGYAGTVSAPGGRWLIYSTDPASDTRGGLVYDFKQYNATYGVTTVAGAANESGFLYTVAPVITPSLSGTATKTYDGDATAPTASLGLTYSSGAIDGDSITALLFTTASYDNKNAGTSKPVTVSADSFSATSADSKPVYGYQITPVSAAIGTITPAPLTVTAQADSRSYNGTVSSSVAPVLSGTVYDPIGTAATQVYATKNATTSKTITASGLVMNDGNAGLNYSVSYVVNTNGVITPAPLMVTANNAGKTYGQTLTFTGTEFAASGLQNGETIGTVTLTSAGAPATAPVGPYAIVPSAATGGTFNVGNYAITYNNGTLTVSPAPLTVTANDAAKTYGQTLTFTGTEFVASGLQNGETVGAVTLTSDGAPATAPAGPYAIIPSAATGGTFNVGNYAITYNNGTLTISAAPLSLVTASLTGTASKTYDGTTIATLAPGNFLLTGFVNSDSASVTKSTGTYAGKNVGSGILVSTTLAATDYSPVGATNLSNYTLPTSASGNIGNITPASLAVSGLTANNKVYDGTTAASVSGTLGGVIAGDAVSLATGAFSDKNVGTAKPVTVTSLGLTGADAGNYSLSGSPTTTADITVRPLSTWIGGASGNWSVASNWDALPDLSNVQAVSVPAGMSVIYDAAAGSTNLASLTAGGLGIAGGSLSIASGLTVNSSFSQTGGTLSFDTGASASITQASGNLNLPAFTLASLSLNAPAGAIAQSGPIVAAALNTQSQTGTTLDNAGNRIASFGATNSGSGNVALTNTGALTVTGIINTVGGITIDNTGAVTTVGPVIASGGPVTIVGHSPVTIGAGGVSSSGDIVLTAGNAAGSGDDLTLSGPVSSTGGGSVALSSGDNLLQNANVTTNGGAVTAASQTGNISMGLGTTTSTDGGGIGYTSSGNVALTGLNAGSGAIDLNAGGDIGSVSGFTGANLIGGQALIVAGGNANLSTQVGLLDVKVKGTYSIIDLLTGRVITSVPVAAPALNQVTSTVLAATQSVSATTTTQPADDKEKEDEAKKKQQTTLITTTGAGTDVKPKNFCN